LIEIDEQFSCLRLASVSKDEHHCMVCGIACRTRVPRTAAVDVYMKRKLFVPKGIRCCAGHLTSDNKLDSSSIEKIQRSNDVQLEGEEVQSFLDEICETTQGQFRL
jgi:transcription elongation factor Elf1